MSRSIVAQYASQAVLTASSGDVVLVVATVVDVVVDVVVALAPDPLPPEHAVSRSNAPTPVQRPRLIPTQYSPHWVTNPRALSIKFVHLVPCLDA
jgi:hypothetical protein